MLLGAILAPGKRTVTAALRIVGLGQQTGWHQYHRVLSRVKWSARAASRLLTQLVAAFLPTGPLVFGLDETLERRWGPRIAARVIYRDAVRSSDSHLVKCSGPITAVPAYLTEKADEATGEVVQVSRFRYLPGHPRPGAFRCQGRPVQHRRYHPARQLAFLHSAGLARVSG